MCIRDRAWSGAVDTDGTTPVQVGISGLLYTRANSFYKFQPPHPAFQDAHSQIYPNRPINSIHHDTLSNTVGYNITEGVITYAYSYDD